MAEPTKPVNILLMKGGPGERRRASSYRPAPVQIANSPAGSGSSGLISPSNKKESAVGSLPQIHRKRIGTMENTQSSSSGSPLSPTTTTIMALGQPQVGSPVMGKGRVSIVSMMMAPQRSRNTASTGSIPALAHSGSQNDLTESLSADLSEYHLEKVVQGGQGTVYRGTCPMTGQEVAVKKSNLKSEAPRVNAEREREVLLALAKQEPHPGLMSAERCTISNDEMITVMKYYPTDLYTALKDSGKASVTGQIAYRLTDEILDATEALHKRGFVHRDIKPENIMLTSKNLSTASVVLCDYGLCGIISKTVFLKSSCGSKRYAAPEVWNKDAKDVYDGIKVDMWSIGMVFFCLYCGFCPWETAGDTDKVFRVWRKDTQVFYDWAKKFSTNELDPMTKMIFRGLCHPNPAERFNMAEARKLIKNKRF